MSAELQPLPRATEDAKALATAAARCARLGIVLLKIDGDFGRPVYIATLHALTKSFDNLGEVEAWLTTIRAPS